MNQILSQSEVDALLNAVKTSTDSDTSDNTKEKKLQKASPAYEGYGADTEFLPYDLTSQDKIVRGRMPTLDIIYERFSRLFRISLSSALRKIATISIVSTDLLKFGEFINTLPVPSAMGILRFESLKGSVIIVLETKLAYTLVDNFFGGTDNEYTRIEGKEYTRIELSILRKVIDLAIKDLDEAWAPVHKADLSFVRTEVNPQFVGVVPPSDIIISTTFEVELDSSNGTLSIIIPYSTIEPIKGKLNSSFQTEVDNIDREVVDIMEEHLKDTEVNVVINLGAMQINVSDLVHLSLGDIIPLNQDADGELDVLVEGIVKFKCLLGVFKGNKAVQITKVVENI